LAKAARSNPKLIVIIVTIPDLWADFESVIIGIASPSTYWTADSFNIIAKVVPDFNRYCLKIPYTNANGKHEYTMVDIHVQIMIIDDEWYTIGSCNINERGFLYEGEINIGIHDPEGAYNLRHTLWSEHLQVSCPKNIYEATLLWDDHARKNVQAEKNRSKHISRIFSFAQGGPVLPMTHKAWL
jgi:phosphatidylserine/phosphatidylglycerophosphate/cardiolipin synthase-like enzyme